MAKSDAFTLDVATRKTTGTTSVRALRRSGRIPGVLYGHGSEPLAVALDARAVDTLLHSGAKNHLLKITIDGKSPDTALVRDVQRDPVSRKPIHADLQRVSASEAINATLPVIALGVAAGVRDSGGVLDIVSHTVEVNGPADKLPEHIELDVSQLALHDHITAADVKLPAGFKMNTPPDTILVSVGSSRTAQQLEEAAVAAPEAVETPVATDQAAPAPSE